MHTKISMMRGTSDLTRKPKCDNAASLFDSIFDSDNSSPSNSSQESLACPELTSSQSLCSPPAVIESPIKTLTGIELSDDSDDDVNEKAVSLPKPQTSGFSYKSATATNAQRPACFQSQTTTTISRKRPSPTPLPAKRVVDEYDFETQYVLEKRQKPAEKSKDNYLEGQKFFANSRRKVIYSHNWTESPNLEENEEIKVVSAAPEKSQPSHAETRLGKVKQAQQCLESGELDDFKQELDYILTTLLDAEASQNLKHLSAVQLAKKCTFAEFRRFLRTQNVLSQIFSTLSDCQGSPMVSLTTAVIIYFLARDQKSVPITDVSIRLISDLLRQEQNRASAGQEFKKHSQLIWSIIKDWLSKCAERTSKLIHFGLTEETLSASFLILEALAYISVREHNDYFKTELLNSGCLQWIVAKLDKAVLKLSYSSGSTNNEIVLILEEIERCFRILENAAAFNKKNQAYLINHRNGLLLEAGAKFLNYFKDFSEKYDMDLDSTSQKGKILTETLDCVCLLSRVFMNVSHENELCSKKLGQKEGFLAGCLNILSTTAPRIVSKEKFFDVCVMMYGLLVNLVERCSMNRQKLLEINVQLFDAETKNSTSMPVLEALAKLFVKHDLAARTLDEELDNELAFEEPVEDEEVSNQGATQSSSQESNNEHRLQRPVELSEDEMLNAVQGAMNKASAHMEDSMLASYLALLVGCLLQMDQNLANDVKIWLPDKNLAVMVEQLERFLEFMKLTKMKQGATRSIERIIQSMQLLL